MIRINLANRKQAGASGGPPSGGTGVFKTRFGGLDRFTVDIEAFKSLPLRKLILCALVGFIANWTVENYKETEMQKLEAEYLNLKKNKDRLNAEITGLKAAEETMKTLEGDEQQIRTKVETIKKLIDGRGNPPKILAALSRSVPKDVWVSEFKIDNFQIAIKGYSLGFNQISDFMKSLAENTFFSELTLKSSVTEANSEIANFELAAKQR